MPSDTFAEVVRWLDAEAKHYDEEVAVNYTRAARLLDAAGRECGAVRIREHTESMTGGMYNNLRERVGVARAALDALAPDMSAALTPPTKEAE